MAEIRGFLISVAVLSCVLVYTDSCTCRSSTHPQEMFCKADYVIKARVKGRDTLYTKYLGKNYETGEKISYRRPFQQRYTIRIMKIYKGEEGLQNISRHYLISAFQSSMCGVTLEAGMKYIIMGSFHKGQMHINMCQYNRNWSDLKGRERRALHLYGKQCDRCEIQACYRTNCNTNNISHICSWDLQHYASDCYIHSACMKHDRNTCRWSKNAAFRICYKKKKREYFSEP